MSDDLSDELLYLYETVLLRVEDLIGPMNTEQEINEAYWLVRDALDVTKVKR